MKHLYALKQAQPRFVEFDHISFNSCISLPQPPHLSIALRQLVRKTFLAMY